MISTRISLTAAARALPLPAATLFTGFASTTDLATSPTIQNPTAESDLFLLLYNNKSANENYNNSFFLFGGTTDSTTNNRTNPIRPTTHQSNNSNNNSDSIQYPIFPNYIRTTSMVFCIIIMFLGVIGNIMVPVVIFKTKDMRNSTNIFLVNLSAADLMVLLVCTPTVLVEVNSKPETWVLGKEMCKAVPFVELTVAHASVLTILAISFERYYAICKPLKAGYICTKTRASLICVLAWLIAAIFTSPMLVIAEYKYVEYFDGSKVPACHTLANTFWSALYFLSSIFLFFITPFILLIILYCIIARNLFSPTQLGLPLTNRTVTGSNNRYHHHHNNPNFADSYSLRARRQVVLMLGTVVLSFFLCLIPFRVFALWIIIVPVEIVNRLEIDKYYNILYFCRIMVYLNSALNPILYNLMSSKFRRGFLICYSLNGRGGTGRRRKRKFFYRGDSTTSTGRNNTFNTSYRSSGYNNVSTKRCGLENEEVPTQEVPLAEPETGTNCKKFLLTRFVRKTRTVDDESYL